MIRSTKIVAAFAALGFFLPIALLTFVWATGYPYIDRPLFALCPQSIVSMALDRASTSTAVTVWFFICLSNAILYAFPPSVVFCFLRVFRPGPTPPSILD